MLVLSVLKLFRRWLLCVMLQCLECKNWVENKGKSEWWGIWSDGWGKARQRQCDEVAGTSFVSWPEAQTTWSKCISFIFAIAMTTHTPPPLFPPHLSYKSFIFFSKSCPSLTLLPPLLFPLSMAKNGCLSIILRSHHRSNLTTSLPP